MKKSSKPYVFIVMLLFLVITLILIAVQGLRFRCEELIRQRTVLEDEIRIGKSTGVNLIAHYQTLTAEDRIEQYAIGVLDLSRTNNEPGKKIIINNIRINEVTEKLNQ